MSFIGTTQYLLDDRKRIPIPRGYRDQFEAPAVMTKGDDPCVLLYTSAGYEEAGAAVNRLGNTPDGRDARRRFFGAAYRRPVDGQGRIQIDPELLDHANLLKEVVVIGAGDYMEIWDKATLEKFNAGGGAE